ncbi:STAS domain-containing protein [Ferriphaselus sp. R-1]|uniref:STAS domain-containing protein n=1 Tax=Ferriphaselus sp. R-1 TaxID=1485544 RepID=UPI00054F70DF|nr:STAS domain-containing protein [Ferriphaselus sp. R-1]
METSVRTSNGMAELHIKGRFDFSRHRGFKDEYEPLIGNDQINVIAVNLSGVDYMDSSALGMLLMLRDRALGANKKVVLNNPNHTVAQILDIANFDKLFTINK